MRKSPARSGTAAPTVIGDEIRGPPSLTSRLGRDENVTAIGALLLAFLRSVEQKVRRLPPLIAALPRDFGLPEAPEFARACAQSIKRAVCSASVIPTRRGGKIAVGGMLTALRPVTEKVRRPPAIAMRLVRDPKVVVAGGFVALLIVLALAAPLIAPKDPLAQNLILATVPPTGFQDAEPGYLLGTDGLGRDVLSRVIYGSRVSLTVAFVAAGLACLIGSLLGLLAGFLRGWVDAVISRLVEVWMAFPPVLLSILLVAVLGTGLHSVIAAIVVIDWTRFCRVLRTEAMAQGQMDYVVAARTIGFSRPAILFREIFPNVMPVLIALLTLEMGIAVVVEAILSFVGLSVSSDTPTWGGMIAEGRQIVHEAWWVLAVPLAALFATVVAFNQLGDGLARSLDPVLRR